MTKKTNNLGISFLHIINPVHIYQSKRPYAYKDEDTESTSMDDGKLVHTTAAEAHDSPRFLSLPFSD